MKITIIGNSVALRVRPSEHESNKNYTYLLQEHFGQEGLIENKALGATTVANWLENSDHIINSFPTYYIINIGVVDATVREVPLWFYRLASRKVDTFATKVVKAIYRGPISSMRPFLSKLRGSRSWLGTKQFKKKYDLLFRTILKETNAQIITLPINLANERIEKQLPGSRKKHQEFNETIKAITYKYGQSFLDLSDLNSEEHYPDGVHFNKKGHQVVTERLVAIFKEKTI